MSQSAPVNSHNQKRIKTRLRIQQCALELFALHGYDQTTVEQIAAAAHVSHMTFFRYFPTKEHVLMNNFKSLLTEFKVELPQHGTIVERVRTVARTIMPPFYDANRETLLTLHTLSTRSPKLRGRLQKNQYVMVDDVMGMLGVQEASLQLYFATRCVVAACLAVMTVAGEEWIRREGKVPIQKILDDGFRALQIEITTN